MLEEANSEIGRALFVGARRRAGEAHINSLMHQIDSLLWELEALNLEDRRFVPDDLLPRITKVVADATESEPAPPAEVRRPLVALDRLFEAQSRLTNLKCRRRGFLVLDTDEHFEPANTSSEGR